MIESLSKINFNGTEINKNKLISTKTSSTTLFDNVSEETEVENSDKETQILEAQRVQYEQELKELEAQKAAKEAEKRALVAQKNVAQAKSDKLDAEIEQNTVLMNAKAKEIKSINDEATTEEEDMNELQAQYDEINTQVQALQTKMTKELDSILKESEENVASQKDKIDAATQEAYAKVQSGEIEESAVAQYVAQKAGLSSVIDVTAGFNSINSLNSQIKSLISQSYSILSIITTKNEHIAQLGAQAISVNEEYQKLSDSNDAKYKEKAPLTKEISDLDIEISIVNNDINTINTKIDRTNAKMNNTEENGNVQFTNTIVERTKIEHKNSANTVALNNPFVAIVASDIDYSSMSETLDEISKSSDSSINNAVSQTEENKKEIRNIFQNILK